MLEIGLGIGVLSWGYSMYYVFICYVIMRVKIMLLGSVIGVLLGTIPIITTK